MANLLYDDNKISYPGEIRISEVALISPYGNVVGISNNVLEIKIVDI